MRVKRKMFGTLTGQFDDAVFREKDGINFVSKAPKDYTKPETESFYNRTLKFKIAVQLTSAVIKNAVLKLIWIRKGVKFANLMSLNYSSIGSGDFVRTPLIAPDDGFGVRYSSAVLDNSDLEVVMEPFTDRSGLDTSVEKKVQLAAVVYLYHPVDGSNRIKFLTLKSSKVDFNLDDPVTLTCPLVTADEDRINEYQDKKVFVTLITYNDADEPVNYARTIAPAV